MSFELDSTWKSVLEELLNDARKTKAESLLLHFLLVDKAGEGFNPQASGIGVMLSELILEHRRHRHKAYSMPVHIYADCLSYLHQRYAASASVQVIRDPIPRETESMALIFKSAMRASQGDVVR